MILNRLRATNVLKYARLELNDLPEKGQIAISGANESGKTALVETICFALFGRTFSQGPDELHQLIRWGEGSCELELVFTANNNKVYTVRRGVDSTGVHSAELYELNAEKPIAVGPHTVHDAIVEVCGFDYPQYLDALYLAQMEISAPHSQSETIEEIAGTSELEAVAVEIEAEIASERTAIRRLESEISGLEEQIGLLDVGSDLAQRLDQERQAAEQQITEHESRIRALEAVAGGMQDTASQLDGLLARLREVDTTLSLSQWRGLGAELKAVAERLDAACQAVDGDAPLCGEGSRINELFDLEQRLEALRPLEERWKAYRAELAHRLGEQEGSAQGGEGPVPLPRQLEVQRRRLAATQLSRGVGQWVFFGIALAALMLWVSWWLLLEPPSVGHGEGLAAGWLAQHVAWWHPEYTAWLFPAAVALSVLAVLSLIWPLRANARAARIRTEIGQLEAVRKALRKELDWLDGLEDRSLPEVDAYLSGLEAQGIATAWQSFVAEDGAIFVDSESLDAYRQEIMDVLRHIAAEVGTLRETVAARIGALHQAISDRRERLKDFDSQYEDWARRRDNAAELQEMIDHLSPRCAVHQEHIRLRELALRLVRDTCRHIYHRFNGVLSKYTGEVMPKLTSGRYSQMQIDEDLGIRVFSSAKNDFAQLKEFSSGTQRQMMLALRLAMAKALVEASGQRSQFIVLDEPFAFFDRERIQDTLTTLPALDKHLSQIWIISQEFESYDLFKLHIQCSRESEELSVG